MHFTDKKFLNDSSSLFIFQSYKRLYKRLNLKFTNWKKFIHTTTSYYVDKTIECGSVCNSEFDQCDMFVYHKEIQRCHIGIFDTDSAYLDGYSGEFPVHLSMSKFTISLK